MGEVSAKRMVSRTSLLLTFLFLATAFLVVFTTLGTRMMAKLFTSSTYTRLTEVEGHQVAESHGRSREIRHRCAELNDSLMKPPTWANLRLHREKHAIVCAVGKAATVSWLRVLLRLTGKPAAIRLASQPRYTVMLRSSPYFGDMRYLNASQRDAVLNRNYKIMLVRDPLTRLISGYREKMLKRDHPNFFAPQAAVKRMFRPNVSTRSEIGLKYVRRWSQLQFDFDSAPVRLQFDRATTIQRPTLRSGCCTTAYVNK